jgi:hypothetical protein
MINEFSTADGIYIEFDTTEYLLKVDTGTPRVTYAWQKIPLEGGYSTSVKWTIVVCGLETVGT